MMMMMLMVMMMMMMMLMMMLMMMMMMASLLLFAGRFGAPAKGADTRPLAAPGGRFLSLEGGCSAPPSPAAMLIDAAGNPSESPLARFSEAGEVCCRLATAASDLKRAISCPFLTPV